MNLISFEQQEPPPTFVETPSLDTMAAVPSPLMSSVASISDDAPKDKNSIIEFAETYSIDLASERFSIPKSTLKSWMKQNKISTKPIYNSPGQGRKISYSQELDNQIADHIRSLINKGNKVTVQDICSYARKLIQKENSDFTASSGWAQRFLVRHNIDLSSQVKKLIPSNRLSTSTSSSSDSRGRPLSYSAETDNSIAEWVRQRTERGEIVTNSELRRYAKEVVSRENQNFTGSASWAQNFLLRHKLSLQPSYLSDTSAVDKSDIAISSSSVPPSSSVESLQIHDVVSSSSSSIVSQSILNPSISSTVDDSVSSTLALLTGEGLPVEGQLSQAALALSDLTSDAALADLLNSTQDPTGTTFNPSSLEPSAAYLSLGHLTELVGSVAAATGNGQSMLGLPPTQTTSQQQATTQSTASNSNSESDTTGSGTRPLSYTKETDQQLANWVKDQQAEGLKVTFASLRSYAKKLVSPENPNFNASVGWVTPFLLRHNLDLKVNDRKSRSTRKTTHPRKLSAKDDQTADDDEQTADIQNTSTPIDERDIEISSLSIVPSLTQSFEHPESIEITSDSLQLGSSEVSMETQESKVDTDDLSAPPSKSSRLNTRSRHTLAEKLEVVRLMRQYNVASHYVSRMIGIATSTLSGWIKLVDQKGAELEALSTNRKRSNRSGQGRPLTYSREKDEVIADWVRQQQEMGVPVTSTDLSNYATTIIRQENQSFVASVGWRHKFLQRHNLHLQQLHASYKPNSSDDQQNVPLPVQTEEVCTDDFTIEVVEKTYPNETTQQLIEWVKTKVSELGSASVQSFCKRAEELITPIDSMFVATLGWAFKFLHRNYLFLDPKPTNVEVNRKRTSTSFGTSTSESDEPATKRSSKVNVNAIGIDPESISVSPSTGNLCEALLSLSSQPDQDHALTLENVTSLAEQNATNTKTYFGKAAREFSSEEKEEVVRYANATTLQKAALKYGVAAPTVWRWRMELKLHQPKYTANQKKYIVKFADTNSLKEASQRFGITTKTIQNWRRSLQMDGTLSDVDIAAIPPPSLQDITEGEGLTASSSNGGLMSEEVIPLDTSHFQYVVDGGEVAEGTRLQGHSSLNSIQTSSPLQVTHEVQVQDVGMEYDVISSEGHAAKPRCTPEEKMHILQYALDHSIREASVKYGVSPGTLYYWKKNYLASQQAKTGTSGSDTKDKSSVIEGLPNTCNLETTVVSVPMPLDIISGTQGLMQPHQSDPLQALAAADPSILGDGTVPTSSLINAITQTLASATPEQLQSLQQITSDLNLLQAVTSLINSQETNQLRQATPTESIQQRESLSGGISSPTDVLVSFNPLTTPTSQTEIITTETVVERVATDDVTTSGDHIPESSDDKPDMETNPSET